MTLKVTEDHKDRWGRIKGAELKKKNPFGEFPSGGVVNSLPLQEVWVQSPVGGPHVTRGVAKNTEHKPICVCAQGRQQEGGLSLPCHPEVRKLLKFPFLSCSLESFANGLTLPSETSCFSSSDKELVGRWLNKNLHTPGLSVS